MLWSDQWLYLSTLCNTYSSKRNVQSSRTPRRAKRPGGLDAVTTSQVYLRDGFYQAVEIHSIIKNYVVVAGVE